MDIVKLTATEGMVLTNGYAYSKEIYLGVNDSAENWTEITEAEYNEIKYQFEVIANAENGDISQLAQMLDKAEEQLKKAYDGRTDFSYAFANTGYTVLPIRNIAATSIIYMLMNCQKLTTCEDVTITVNSDNPSALYVCANCSNMTVAPTFAFKNSEGDTLVQAVKTWTSAFLNCSAMTSCAVYLGDGTQDPVTTRNMFQNSFKNCFNIQQLAFTGHGSPMYLDLSDCKKLTRESMLSLKNALMDVSEAESGVYEIKMAEATYNLYTDEEKAEITALGWTIITKEAENEETN